MQVLWQNRNCDQNLDAPERHFAALGVTGEGVLGFMSAELPPAIFEDEFALV